VIRRLYRAVDDEVPCLRFRGTMIRRLPTGWEIVGWQRNISRLQKFDVSYPTILSFTLDANRRVIAVALDKSYQGSKGLLCHQVYLQRNIERIFGGQRFDFSMARWLRIETLHCFHLLEVMAGVYTGIQLVEEQGWDCLFEEEVTDSYRDHTSFYVLGRQRFDNFNRTLDYSIELPNSLEQMGFNPQGAMISRKPIEFRFFLENELAFSEKIESSRQTPLIKFLKPVCDEATARIALAFLGELRMDFMASNMFYPAFAGLLVQGVAMKKYYNNLNFVLHTLTALQRMGGIPRCVGAVESKEEADCYFTGYDINSIFA
jgi:hypothetical protein